MCATGFCNLKSGFETLQIFFSFDSGRGSGSFPALPFSSIGLLTTATMKKAPKIENETEKRRFQMSRLRENEQATGGLLPKPLGTGRRRKLGFCWIREPRVIEKPGISRSQTCWGQLLC